MFDIKNVGYSIDVKIHVQIAQFYTKLLQKYHEIHKFTQILIKLIPYSVSKILHYYDQFNLFICCFFFK